MPFDVHIDLTVNLDATARQTFPAHAEIRIISNQTENQGKWRLVGRHDRRLPPFGDDWHEWRRDAHDPLSVALTFRDRVFARLLGFQKGMQTTSEGVLYAAQLPGGPPPYQMPNAPGWFVGGWKVNGKARHGNLPTPLMDDSFVDRCISMCNRETGWRYDTSASDGISGGAGAGGGVVRSRLVMKRKEPADKRRWDIVYYAVGLGFTTPGVGYSGSTESTPGGAWSNVMAGIGAREPFHVNDMAGSMVAFEGGAGLAVGKGKAGAGGGRSTTTYLFFGGVVNDGALPDVSTIKCGFQVWSQAGAASRGTGFGASGFLWVGAVTSVTPRG